MREEVTLTCPEHEIILVKSATYGRMQLGRCISREFEMGCKVDVTSVLEGLCSGRHHCQTSVRELILIAQPCPQDFTSYLEVTFICMPGK